MASGKVKKPRSGKSGKSGWKQWREKHNIKNEEADNTTTDATPSNCLTPAKSSKLVEVGQQTDSTSCQSSFQEVGTQTDFSLLVSAPRQGQHFKHLITTVHFVYKYGLLSLNEQVMALSLKTHRLMLELLARIAISVAFIFISVFTKLH